MAEGDLQAASAPGQAVLLDLWEASADESAVLKTVALLSAVFPNTPRDELAALPIGRRDLELLDLHDQLFGSRIECTTVCAECGSTMEAIFDSSDIRMPVPSSRSHFTATLDGITVTARPPDSRDLASLEGMKDAELAWRALADRCIVSARRGRQAVEVADLPLALLEAVETAAGQADPQADVVIGLACPDCGEEARLPFDIGRQMWVRLDHWGRAMLAAIDAIAARYGWSEAEILKLGPKRRQHYLDLAGGVAS